MLYIVDAKGQADFPLLLRGAPPNAGSTQQGLPHRVLGSSDAKFQIADQKYLHLMTPDYFVKYDLTGRVIREVDFQTNHHPTMGQIKPQKFYPTTFGTWIRTTDHLVHLGVNGFDPIKLRAICSSFEFVRAEGPDIVVLCDRKITRVTPQGNIIQESYILVPVKLFLTLNFSHPLKFENIRIIPELVAPSSSLPAQTSVEPDSELLGLLKSKSKVAGHSSTATSLSAAALEILMFSVPSIAAKLDVLDTEKLASFGLERRGNDYYALADKKKQSVDFVALATAVAASGCASAMK